MIYELLLGLGIMAVIEGLVLALAPLRYKDLVEMLSKLTVGQRRTIGLGIMTLGVILLAIAKSGL
jgi:uncharacterized protein YjeT (DUF2065 family)